MNQERPGEKWPGGLPRKHGLRMVTEHKKMGSVSSKKIQRDWTREFRPDVREARDRDKKKRRAQNKLARYHRKINRQ